MSEFPHIMVDIETLSTRPDAAIVTIGAVKFSFNSDDVQTFKVNISPKSSKELGLRIDQNTLDWWRKQKPEAISAWQHSRVGLPEAIDTFIDFCGDTKGVKFWAMGTIFDVPILESSFIAVNKLPIWKYWDVCDARTALFLAGIDTRNEPRVGNYHNAVDDCHTQIAMLKKALQNG